MNDFLNEYTVVIIFTTQENHSIYKMMKRSTINYFALLIEFNFFISFYYNSFFMNHFLESIKFNRRITFNKLITIFINQQNAMCLCRILLVNIQWLCWPA